MDTAVGKTLQKVIPTKRRVTISESFVSQVVLLRIESFSEENPILNIKCNNRSLGYNISESYALKGKTMTDYVAIIASLDDVEDLEELIEMVKGGHRPAHSGFYQCELDTDTPDLVNLVGRGFFFENDWSSDHTVSWIGPASEVRGNSTC